jgi:hypothetical protein
MRRARLITVGPIAALLLLSALSPCAADSLSKRVETIFGKDGIDVATPSHEAHFGADAVRVFGLLLQNLASQAADFPAPATAPGLSFHYNDKLGVFEPTAENFTPPFVDEPRTQGAGRFEVGMSYLFLDFDSLNGRDLDHLQFLGLKHNHCCGGAAFENDTADVFYEKFTLQSHVFAFAGTYGITEDWDVNLLLPVIYTQVDLVARAELHNTTSLKHEFDPTGSTKKVSFVKGDHVGVGDMQLRTKYRFLDSDGLRVGASLSLRLPTGSEDDFQGTGDTKVTPALSVSDAFGKFGVHLATGIEVDASNTDRSRIRYAGGVTYQHLKELAFFFDVIGSSNLQKEELSVTVPQFVNGPNGEELPAPSTTATQKIRTDIVDIAPGIKIQLAPSAVAFFQAFIPANRDGLRTNFTPAGGVEVSF